MMKKKRIYILIGITFFLGSALLLNAQPGKANDDDVDRSTVCLEGINVLVWDAKVDDLLWWCEANNHNCYTGSCSSEKGELDLGYSNTGDRWIRYDGLVGMTGSAGYGKVTFTTHKVETIQATLYINDVGDFKVYNISCTAGVPKVCTGDIYGLPFETEPQYHGGYLFVNDKEFKVPATKVLVPAPIQ